MLINSNDSQSGEKTVKRYKIDLPHIQAENCKIFSDEVKNDVHGQEIQNKSSSEKRSENDFGISHISDERIERFGTTEQMKINIQEKKDPSQTIPITSEFIIEDQSIKRKKSTEIPRSRIRNNKDNKFIFNRNRDESIGTKYKNIFNDSKLETAIKKVQVTLDSKCKLSALIKKPHKLNNLSSGFSKKTNYESLKAMGSSKRAEIQSKNNKLRMDNLFLKPKDSDSKLLSKKYERIILETGKYSIHGSRSVSRESKKSNNSSVCSKKSLFDRPKNSFILASKVTLFGKPIVDPNRSCSASSNQKVDKSK